MGRDTGRDTGRPRASILVLRLSFCCALCISNGTSCFPVVNRTRRGRALVTSEEQTPQTVHVTSSSETPEYVQTAERRAAAEVAVRPYIKRKRIVKKAFSASVT